mmetsp:Transcript_16807/g.54715  ORF Transcript_16807/g.54715 Transcript_16807/m.54715 type:complete len:278 (+) Transcript_16807:187-1020(+)
MRWWALLVVAPLRRVVVAKAGGRNSTERFSQTPPGAEPGEGLLLAATGKVIRGEELATLLAEACVAGVATTVVLARRRDSLAAPCATTRVANLESTRTFASVRDYRRFKLTALAKFCPYPRTTYLDNDVEVADFAALFQRAFNRSDDDDAASVGVAEAANCVPKGHSQNDVPNDFCERQGGVLALRCDRKANLLMRRWLHAFLERPVSRDGHDQPALRRVAYEHRSDFYDLPRDELNCRHPCKQNHHTHSRCLVFHAHIPGDRHNRSEDHCFFTPPP